MTFQPCSKRRYLVIASLVIFILGACNAATPRKAETDIENPEAQSLKLAITPTDVPGKWSWERATVHQSSKVDETQTDMIDTTFTGLIGDYRFERKEYYIWIIHWISIYPNGVPSVEANQLHSAFEEDGQESELPSLQKFGDKMIAKCFDSEVFLDCTIVVSYEIVESKVSLIAPKGLGLSELGNLINAILSVNDKKITGASTP